jgi:hypothetical protein
MRTRAARFVGTLVISLIGLSPVGLVGIVPAQETLHPGGELVFVVSAEAPSFDAHREENFSLIHPAAPHYSKVHYIFAFQWHRIVPHNARLKGWTITPSHFLNNQLDTVWLAPE